MCVPMLRADAKVPKRNQCAPIPRSGRARSLGELVSPNQAPCSAKPVRQFGQKLLIILPNVPEPVQGRICPNMLSGSCRGSECSGRNTSTFRRPSATPGALSYGPSLAALAVGTLLTPGSARAHTTLPDINVIATTPSSRPQSNVARPAAQPPSNAPVRRASDHRPRRARAGDRGPGCTTDRRRRRPTQPTASPGVLIAIRSHQTLAC